MTGTPQPLPPAAWSPPPGWYPDPSLVARGRPLAVAGAVILGLGAVLALACWKLGDSVGCPNGCSASVQPTVPEVLIVSGFAVGLLLSVSGLIATVVGIVSARAGQVRHDHRYWDGHGWTAETSRSGFTSLALGIWLLAAGVLAGVAGAASFSTELQGSAVFGWAFLALLAAILLIASGTVVTIIAIAGRYSVRSKRT